MSDTFKAFHDHLETPGYEERLQAIEASITAIDNILRATQETLAAADAEDGELADKKLYETLDAMRNYLGEVTA